MKKFVLFFICLMTFCMFYIVGRPTEDPYRHRAATVMPHSATIEIALRDDEAIYGGDNNLNTIIPAGTNVKVEMFGNEFVLVDYGKAQFRETPEYIVDAVVSEYERNQTMWKQANTVLQNEHDEYLSRSRVWFLHDDTNSRLSIAIVSSVVYFFIMFGLLMITRTNKDCFFVSIVAVLVPVIIYFCMLPTYICR